MKRIIRVPRVGDAFWEGIFSAAVFQSMSISVNLKDHFRFMSVRANSGCPSVSSERGERETGRSISRPAKLRTDETHERRAPRSRAITALRGIHITPCFCYCGAPSRKIHVPFASWHP